MSDEPTPADAELRERSLRELTSLTYGWTLFQVVRLSESEHQREVDDEILTAHGYHYTWGTIAHLREPRPERHRRLFGGGVGAIHQGLDRTPAD